MPRNRPHRPNCCWVVGVSRLAEQYERIVCFCLSEAEAREVARVANQHAPTGILYYAEYRNRCVPCSDSLGRLPTPQEEALWLANMPFPQDQE